MSSVVHKTKLLVIDTSTSMAQVLRTYVEINNYDADVFSDSAQACNALANRFSSYSPTGSDGGGYDCVVLGWPKDQAGIIKDLLKAMASADHSDLPLIVLSEEPDKDVEMITRRRAKTRSLLWRDHKRLEDLIDSLVIHEMPSVPVAATTASVSTSLSRGPGSVLLVDDTPSICHTLRDLLESNGYQVTIASSASEARTVVAKNKFDLVLTEFFLLGESGEDFCRYLQTLNSSNSPVYAVLTRKNSQSVVQRSLAVGAISCLDKSESSEVLFARVDAIAKGLSTQTGPAISVTGAAKNDTAAANAGFEHLMKMSFAPTVCIDKKRNIVAANAEAARLLAAGDVQALTKVNFEKSIHGAPVKRSSDQPVKALFRNLAGESLSVAYRSRDINGTEHGLQNDVCMLTFESVDESNAPATKAFSTSGVADRTFAKNVGESALAMRVDNVQPVASAATPDAGSASSPQRRAARVLQKEIPARRPVMASVEVIEASIDKALSSDSKGSTCSLLMLDLKMVASVTGDSLGLSHSQPMVELVKAELLRCYPRKNSLAVMDDGKFVLLFESINTRQALTHSEKLVNSVPVLLKHLSEVELLSHSAFMAVPSRSDLSARFILKHLSVACLKTEIDGRDNQVFNIDTREKLPARSPADARDIALAKRPVKVQRWSTAAREQEGNNQKVSVA